LKLGDKIKEIIDIQPISNIDAHWYHVFSQKLIFTGFTETKPYHWEKSFIFTVEEKRAIKTPAERALRQAIILAGQCPCHVTLQIGNFSAYQMTTRDFMKMSHLFMPFSYKERLELQENR
jgi:hypothetical protein